MRVWIIAALLCASAAEFAFAQLAPLSPQLTYDAAALRATAPMADLSGATLRNEVLASPLFVAELDSRAIQRGGPLAIDLEPGIQLDLQKYLASTALELRPVLKLASEDPGRLGLAGPVTVTEEVFVMSDRIIVSREAVIPVTAETCGYSQAKFAPLKEGRARRAARTKMQELPAGMRDELCLMPGERSVEDLASEAEVSKRPVIADRYERLSPGLEERMPVIDPQTRLILPPTREDIRQEAALIRAELAALRAGAEFRKGVSVQEALELSDEALIRLDANGDERVITFVSIIPLANRSVPPEAFSTRLDAAELGRGFALSQPIGAQISAIPPALSPFVKRKGSFFPDRRVETAPRGELSILGGAASQAPGGTILGVMKPSLSRPALMGRIPGTETEARKPVRSQRISQSADVYFITGFTLTDRIEERYKHTFNRKRNYYIAFEYSIGYRAGLRFPFRVNVESEAFFREDPQTRAWDASSFHFRVNAEGRQNTLSGGSVYRAAGMPEDMIFEDREFTFGVWAGCQLQLRVPIIKTVRINCPSVDVPRAGTCPDWACADFVPPVGGRRLIAEPRLPADLTRMQLNAWIARAGIEPGVNIYAANPEFALKGEPLSGEFSSPGEDPSNATLCAPGTRGDPRRSNTQLADGDCQLVFDKRYDAARPMVFQLDVSNPADGYAPGVVLSDPEYRFTMEFVPVLELFAVVDIAVAKWRFDQDFEIAGLTIRQDLRFGHHDQTRERVEIGLCGPADISSPACQRAAGYVFHPVWIDDGS
jgi:hypothetical protein